MWDLTIGDVARGIAETRIIVAIICGGVLFVLVHMATGLFSFTKEWWKKTGPIQDYADLWIVYTKPHGSGDPMAVFRGQKGKWERTWKHGSGRPCWKFTPGGHVGDTHIGHGRIVENSEGEKSES